MNECRLCSIKTDLINIFDQNLKNSKELRYFINLATGVEIRETDIVSKLICRRCCILAIKMYKYRTKAVANDKVLKEQCGQQYFPPPLSPLQSCSNKSGESSNTSQDGSTIITSIKKHPSVQNVMKRNPNVIIPAKVFKSHIDPVITVYKDEVQDWFKKHNVIDFHIVKEIQKKLTNITIRKVATTSDTENYEVVEKEKANKNCPAEREKIYKNCTAEGEKINKNCSAEKEKINKNSSAEREEINKNSSVEKEKINKYYTSYKKQGDVVSSEKKVSFSKNVARKRTSSINTNKRRFTKKKKVQEFSDSEDDIMPLSKRKKITEQHLLNLEQQQLVEGPTGTKGSQKQQFISDLGLLPIEKTNKIENNKSLSPEKTQMLHRLKEVNLFVCNICNRVCDTKKELNEHQKVHLQCKFCKTKVKTIDALLEHLNETCFINLTTNLPNILLNRVDQDPDVINRYRSAFNIVKPDVEDSDSGDYDGFVDIEEVNVPEGGGDDLIDETSETLTTSFTPPNDVVISTDVLLTSALTKEEHPVDDYIKKSVMNALKKKITASLPNPTENIVCISDDSEDDKKEAKKPKPVKSPPLSNAPPAPPMESVSVIRPDIKVSQCKILSPQAIQTVNKENLGSLEESIIQNLFQKYSLTTPNDKSTQIFVPTDSSLKILGNKLMSVENMFLELAIHKVPVELVHNDSVKITFQKTADVIEKRPNFSWKAYPVYDLKPHLPTLIPRNFDQPSDKPNSSNVQNALVLNGCNYLPNNLNSSSVSLPKSTATSKIPNPTVNTTIVAASKGSPQFFHNIIIPHNQISATPITTSSNAVLFNQLNFPNRITLPSAPKLVFQKPPQFCPQTQTKTQISPSVVNTGGIFCNNGNTAIISNSSAAAATITATANSGYLTIGNNNFPIISQPLAGAFVNYLPACSNNTNISVTASSSSFVGAPSVVTVTQPSQPHINTNNTNDRLVASSTNSVQPVNENVQTPGGNGQTLLRVKNLWELTNPKL